MRKAEDLIMIYENESSGQSINSNYVYMVGF